MNLPLTYIGTLFYTSLLYTYSVWNWIRPLNSLFFTSPVSESNKCFFFFFHVGTSLTYSLLIGKVKLLLFKWGKREFGKVGPGLPCCVIRHFHKFSCGYMVNKLATDTYNLDSNYLSNFLNLSRYLYQRWMPIPPLLGHTLYLYGVWMV